MTKDWLACDGTGGDAPTPRIVSRRAAIGRVIAGAALAQWAGRSALAQVAVDTPGTGRDVLVTLFLRGGADGLSVVVPHGDGDYYRARPTLGLSPDTVLDLDGFFGLHPSLAALLPLYKDGRMAAIHAVGSQDRTRSHFEAMATVERGLLDNRATEASGWLGRYLAATPAAHASPLRAVAWGDLLPDSLRGALDATALSSLDQFRLDLPADRSEALTAGLAALYGGGADAVSHAGRETLSVLDSLHRIDPSHYRPENGARYPGGDLGNGLRQVASLIKADIGLEVACLDRGGWDTHVGQGGSTGWLSSQLKDVGDSLGAFLQDLGPAHTGRVTVVVMTEFGRRVAENSGLGTDHGRASAMLLLGGGINGGRVYGRWPGLAAAALEGPGDLPVTTDYRTVLAEVVARRLNPAAPLPAIFPGGDALENPSRFLGVARPV
jgi:uncharacterized protein (DUF1501 family)